MTVKKNKQKIDISPEEVIVYALAETGVPVKEMADKTGKTRQTIYNWINRVREFVKSSEIDIDDYRSPIHALYPLWLRSVIMNLKACDTTMTIALGKGMQYFVDRQETKDVKGHSDRSTDDLKGEIIEILTSGGDKKTAEGEN